MISGGKTSLLGRAAREITDEGWGLLTALKTPGGGELGLYQPKHASAIS